MHEDVLGADCGKAIAAMIPDTLRKAGHEKRILEVRPFLEDKLSGIGQTDQVLDRNKFGPVEVKLVGDLTSQRFWHRGAAYHVNDGAAPSTFDKQFKQTSKVFGFFFYLDVTVANDAEKA